tara:strand:+ start:269 stop:757 length:489 start_codon:yes stop_codon:yes gene_type:complete
MGEIHQFTSTEFIQSGSIAKFESGIDIEGNLIVSNSIRTTELTGLVTSNTSTPTLNVGKAINNDDGSISYEEWTTPLNTPVRITASGDFNKFCFIENQTLTDADTSLSTWTTVEKGTGNGLTKTSFYNTSYETAGIYEYLIIASNTVTLQTVVKGTTVTITD